MNDSAKAERGKDGEKSVSHMPKWLVAAAVILLAARAGDVLMSQVVAHAKMKNDRNSHSISWAQIPSRSEIAAEAKRIAATPTKPAMELSSESQEHLRQLLAEAKKNGKHLLLEFYADWSDPCKKMEATSMSNSQVADLVDANFMPVRINDTQKQFGVNSRFVSDLQKRYRVFAFPTLIVVGADESPVASLIGNCSSLTTFRFLSRALSTTQVLRPESIRVSSKS